MMRYALIVFTIFVSTGIFISCGKKAEVKTETPKAERSLGEVDFANSCDPVVNETFNSSVALLHHMMYGQSELEFMKVVEMDPDCAMAHWGVAITQFHPLWAPPSKEELQKGHDAIQKAKELNAKTEREKQYISAVEAFYKGWDIIDHKTRIAAWSEGQKAVYENNPDDIDAGAFYALSLLATAPKEEKTFTNQMEAGLILEELLKTAPSHPGLFHYTIHAYDNPVLAPRAVPVARDYDKLAPNVPHALHMPSHIFVRLGYWQDTIDWNIRSANAAEEQSTDFMILHYAHAVDYLVYAYLQKGQYNLANEQVEKINSIPNHQDSFISAYGIAGAQSRGFLEAGLWKEASELSARTHSEFPWDKYPQYEAITYYAKGLGAARSGDVESAKVYKSKLDELYQKTSYNGETYWRIIVDAQRKTVDAWITYISVDENKGLEMMRAAADLEDSVDKHPVTPGAVMPARDMLGDMLLKSKNPAEALLAYEKSLKISPGRAYSLFGAGHSAEILGDAEVAAGYYEELVEIMSEADSETDRINHAKSYLN